MLKLVFLTAAAVFTAETLVMLFLESFGSHLPFVLKVFLDSFLLLICVFPTLYFLVFKKMAEQIRLRRQAEQTQKSWNQSLELMVEERTDRLQRANEDLLVEVQERARSTMALRTALNEARSGKEQLNAIINSIRDALVVVDDQWRVQVVNQAAESMFNSCSYDLQGTSLKKFLLPWSQSPTDLDGFFEKKSDNTSTFLIPPAVIGQEKLPVQMRFGAELEWQGQASTVLMFYYRSDLPERDLQPIQQN